MRVASVVLLVACAVGTGSACAKPVNTAKKVTTTVAPTTVKPVATTAKPVPTTAKPVPTTAKPVPTTVKPSPTTAKPATAVARRPSVTAPVTVTGWDSVRVGMTYPALKAVLPAGTARPQGYDDFDGSCWYVQPLGRKGPAIMMLAAADSTAVSTATVARVESWLDDAKPLTTALGVGPGSTKAQVLAAYPAAVSSPHKYTDNGVYLDVKLGTDRMLRFELPEGDLVEAMFIGTTEAASYVEGCA